MTFFSVKVEIFLGEIGSGSARTRFDTTRIPQERGGNKLIFFSLKRGKFQGKKNARAAGNGKIKRYSVQHKSELCKISLATV